jgi:hypothetical protein
VETVYVRSPPFNNIRAEPSSAAPFPAVLKGRTVFIIEGEPVMSLQFAVEDLGAEVVGVVSSVASAERMINEGKYFDLAIVDLQVTDGNTGPLIKALSERGTLGFLLNGCFLSSDRQNRLST